MDGSIVPDYSKLTNPVSKGGLRWVHFTLQQIQRIGIEAGFAKDGPFARRLKDLSNQELADKLRKILERGYYDLAYRSYELGRKIVQTETYVDKNIDAINVKINKLESNPDKKSKGKVEKLKRQRDRLKEHKSNLKTHDKARRNAETPSDLRNTENEVQDIQDDLARMSDPRFDFDFSFPDFDTDTTQPANKNKPRRRKRLDLDDLEPDEA